MNEDENYLTCDSCNRLDMPGHAEIGDECHGCGKGKLKRSNVTKAALRATFGADRLARWPGR